MDGGTTFHFVTDGVEAALEGAKEAAGGKDVSLGGGTRLLEDLGDAKLEPVRVVDAPGVTHLKFRVA